MRTTMTTIALASCLQFGFGSMAAAEDYNVTVVTGQPLVFRWVRQFPEAFIPTMERKLEGTEHTMSFSEQYGGSIAGAGEELETVEAGLAELGICHALFDPDKLPLQNVTYYTPFVSDDTRAINELMDGLHKTDERLSNAFRANGVVYLGGPVAIDDYMLMTNFPVNSLDDLEGRKIAAPGAAVTWLSGTGAVGVAGNLTTYYNEMKTGVYDGVIIFISGAMPSKLYEVAPYVTKLGMGAQFAGGICANADWFDGLPTEVRDALLEAADASKAWYLDDLEEAVRSAFPVMEQNGVTITEASPEMRQAWANGMENAAKNWAQALADRGEPAPEILSAYMDGMRAKGAEPVRDWDRE